jgi:alginate O-acetyltransferase complex protein AlgJ
VATAGSGWFAAVQAANARIMTDIAAYETELEDRDPIVGQVVPWMQLLITGWLRGGNEDAYCGRGDWLFYRRDVDSLTGPGFLDPAVLARRAAAGSELAGPPQPDPVKAIVDFRDRLAARGIALVVMPVPVKASILPEKFSSCYAAAGGPVNNPSYTAFLEWLVAAKVSVFDPTATLLAAKAADTTQSVYLATDTHWTPPAMQRCAGALAAVVREAAELTPAAERLRVVKEAVEGTGDIAGMLDFPTGVVVFPREPVTIETVLSGDGFAWRPDPAAEILLLGDSFTNIFSLEAMGWGESAGLAEHLAVALGLPVDVIARNDAGSHATREMLSKELARGRDRLAGKKVVVWEFAARELAGGDWKILPLDVGQAEAAEFYVPPAGQTVEVRGTVRAVSRAPRPGSVPYKDHIVMVHLVDLDAPADRQASPPFRGREAVVFQWSMRDNVATAAARYRAGDEVTLRLRRWDDVAETHEAINRSELDDEALLLADPAWGE